MKRYLLIFVITLSSASSHAITAKEVCNNFKPIVDQLQDQLPTNVDYMTVLTGLTVNYISDNCFLYYSYIIKSEPLLKEMMEENMLSLEENLNFLNTDEGREVLTNVFDAIALDSAKTNFGQFLDIPGLKVTYYYKFDNFKIQSIKAKLIDN